ncbi:WhiB family transcriptional regulator [Streptomyces sp. UNOC14_S4]|uniref:WhiB family transcriptional regulator n=1 Tax=Streptomyces sp. UNOC14_S4 TaxID=2872340 RepID=UPI001E401299|nr:WhiB family transcriptional regulator [Streptomyces sp. UNOC14_S4]MCC3771348.1 WhiB family transcriptional regulator [Streptomyces sp. UNOC14_S4]
MHARTTTATPASNFRRLGDQSWHDKAACGDLEPDVADRLFFPTSRARKDIAQARALCAQCPVRRICLDAALESESFYGIRGGMTEDERRPLHHKLDYRLDGDRVAAALRGLDVHLSSTERAAVARLAYLYGFTAEQLAWTLKVSQDWATDLLRNAHNEIEDRDRYWHEAGGNDEPANDAASGTTVVPGSLSQIIDRHSLGEAA